MAEYTKNSNIAYLWKNIQLMQRLLFIISYPFIFLISKLPFKVLYVLSDVFYLIIYKLIGYRRNVVKNNIQIAFPEKSKDERIEIEKRFYKHFCDLIFETIKTYSISKKELVNRFKITNPDVITK
jgi:KDO2-lipid IV(A) lauroyltransferase